MRGDGSFVLDTSIGDTSRKDSTEVPKDPLDNFVVPLAGTPHGEGSFHLSGLFPWIAGLGPMLDGICSEESFKGLSEEPL